MRSVARSNSNLLTHPAQREAVLCAGWLQCFRSRSNSNLLTHPAQGVGIGAAGALLFKYFGRASNHAPKQPEPAAEPDAVEKETLKQPQPVVTHGAEPAEDHAHAEHHAMTEVAMFFFLSLGAFYFAEVFHLSGIISSLFAGARIACDCSTKEMRCRHVSQGWPSL